MVVVLYKPVLPVAHTKLDIHDWIRRIRNSVFVLCVRLHGIMIDFDNMVSCKGAPPPRTGQDLWRYF